MAALSNGNQASSSFNTPSIKFTKLFINGQFVHSLSGKEFETIDPRTEEVIAKIAEGGKEDIDVAVKAARVAFDHGPWPRMPGAERARIMMKWADLIEQNIDEIAALEALDAGKLYHFCKAVDIPSAANTIRYYAGAADKIHGEVLKASRELHAYTLLEPIGVVGHIIPWNFPTTMFVAKVSPSLAAGCTMVLKPAEQTPLSALFYAHLSKLAGIPDGVLNVVPGFGLTAGAAICSHMDIDKVSFTGSTEVGREVMRAAANSNLKPVSLELGGKSPMIVFDDADVNKAAELALLGFVFNKGEICVAGTRVLVQEGIYDEFEKKLVEKAKAWVVGDPFDPKVQQGPQVNQKQFERILSYIELGKTEGATLLTGGKRVGNKGYYIEPTIFSNVKEDMRIVQEEIFGPVMVLMKFKTDMALVLDVARFKYPPHWIPLKILWEGMNYVDEATGRTRGFMLVSRPHREPGLLYTLSCKHESWINIAKFLMDDVPLLLKSVDVKDVHQAVSIIVSSLPSSSEQFIKWVAEIRRREDGGPSLSAEEKARLAIKEEVLKQVQETDLFKHVASFLSNSCSRESLDDEDTVPVIATSVCCPAAEILAWKPCSPAGYRCQVTCMKRLKAEDEKPITMISGTVVNGNTEQGVDVLVPSSCRKLCSSCSSPSDYMRMHPASTDVLTVLLLSLPSTTWAGITDKQLLTEIHGLVSTENLPSLLQEEVLHLRRQLHLLKRCQEGKVDQDLGAPLS